MTDLQLGIGCAIIIAIVIINFAIQGVEKKVFNDTYDMSIGVVWGFALLLLAGLLIPQVRGFDNELIYGMIGMTDIEWLHLPEMGSVLFWILLAISLLIVIGLWIAVETDYNFIVKTFLMLFFSGIHVIAWYFIIGVALRMLLVAIIGVFVYGFISSDDNTSKSTSKDPEPNIWKFYDANGKQYIANHKTDYGGYCIMDEYGNTLFVRKFNEEFYEDDKGNMYQYIERSGIS